MKREFFVNGRYPFLEVKAWSGDENGADRFLAVLENGKEVVMKPMYGHFGPCDEDSAEIDWNHYDG